jgi:hypothetical protein
VHLAGGKRSRRKKAPRVVLRATHEAALANCSLVSRFRSSYAHFACVSSVRWQKRSMDARMASADFVQRNGLGAAFLILISDRGFQFGYGSWSCENVSAEGDRRRQAQLSMLSQSRAGIDVVCPGGEAKALESLSRAIARKTVEASKTRYPLLARR